MTHSVSTGSTLRRTVAGLLVGGVLASLATVAPAAAQDLEDRRRQVTEQIDRRAGELDHSTGRLAAAVQRQAQAEAGLRSARDVLAATRGEAAAARAFDAQMQAELTAAVAELRQARRAVEDGRASVADQEDRLAQVAVSSYQSGDPGLLALSTVFNSQDPVQLGGQLNSVRNVLDKESVTLDKLEASRVILEVKEERFAEAKAEVALRRAEAAENLREKELLEVRAQEEASRIEQLVAERAVAREAAEVAKAEDAQQLTELESERDRISSILRQRAAEAKAAAEAAEAAEAARQAALEAKRAARAQARREAREAAAAKPSRKAPRENPAPEPAPQAPAPAAAAPAPSAVFRLLQPVSGYLTSSYGMRLHPVYKRWTLHDGTDWGAACGTPIRAASSGTVVDAYYNSAYGNRVIIDHGYRRGTGLATTYNHLSSFSTYAGQRVERGEVIGYVGSTGYSTGCHLHFMVLENGSTVNPANWL